MKQNKFGEIIFNQDDIFDLVMRGHNFQDINGFISDTDIDPNQIQSVVENFYYQTATSDDMSIEQYDLQNQKQILMPQAYQDLDIAKLVLDLCQTDQELQRCAAELLLFQQHDLLNILKYMKYLVDIMTENQVIWGVGRGSSVASFVLYKLGVHKVNSLYYDLDIQEFLR